MIKVYRFQLCECTSSAIIVSEADSNLLKAIDASDGIVADVTISGGDITVGTDNEEERETLMCALTSYAWSNTNETVVDDCGMKEFKVKFIRADECDSLIEELVNAVDEESCDEMKKLTETSCDLLITWDE